jgi:hypothetical protein
MSGRRQRLRARVAALVVATLSLILPFATATAASAITAQPVTVVTTVDGAVGRAASVGVPSTLGFTLTNRSTTTGAKLGGFTLVVPSGVTGLAVGQISPMWAARVLPCGAIPRCGALVLASATQAAGLVSRDRSVTLTVRMTPSAAGVLSFPLLVIGNGLFTATPTPTVTVGRPPAALRITSVTDTSHTPALPLPLASGSFDVAFDVLDSAGKLATSPNVTVALNPLNGSGTLLAAPVTSRNGTGVVHATYSTALDGLTLQLSSVGLIPASATLNVAADGSATGLPDIGLVITAGDISLPTGLAIANLPHGANGPVSLTIGPCVPDGTTSCPNALSEMSLEGNFKDAAGQPLYSRQSPASVSWTCNEVVCPPPSDFVSGKSTPTQLQGEEFRTHPMYVSLRDPKGTYQPFTLAPPCSGLEGTPIPTGQINTDAPFCVDVGAIQRTDERCSSTACSAWSGPVTIPVLFVVDPRFMAT